MEAVGSAASIIGIIEASQKIIQWTLSYTTSVLNASKEAKSLSDELIALNTVLVRVQATRSGSHLDQLKALFNSCYQDLITIQSKLRIGPARLEKVVNSLTWPFNKKEIQGYITKLQRWVQLFNLDLANESLSKIYEISATTIHTDEVVARTEQLALSTDKNVRDVQQGLAIQNLRTERDDILRWLFRVNYVSNHKTASRLAHPTTGQWWLLGWEYTAWLEDPVQPDRRCLWLPGIAGLGKTVLMSLTIDATVDHFRSEDMKTAGLPPTGVAYFYFDYSDRLKQSPETMLVVVIRQLLEQLEYVPLCVRDLRNHLPPGDYPDIYDAVACLVELSKCFKSLTLLFDALDEADPGQTAVDAIVMLVEQLPASSRFIITSRDEIYIRNGLIGQGFSVVPVQKDGVDRDIASYIKKTSETELKARFAAFPLQLREEIITTVTNRSQGMFLSAKWLLYEICNRKTLQEVKMALKSIPVGISNIYLRVLQQIDDEDLKWVLRALFWLCVSTTQMGLDSLNDALTIDLDNFETSPNDRLLASDTILEICRSLIVSESYDSVSLTHLSLREFLTSTKAGKFYLGNISHMHEVAGRACLSYFLSFDPLLWPDVKALELYKQEVEHETKAEFLEYCGYNWFLHLKIHCESNPESTTQLAEFLARVDETRMYQCFRYLQLIKSEIQQYSYPEKLELSPTIFFGNWLSRACGSMKLTWNSTLLSHLISTKNNILAIPLLEKQSMSLQPDEDGWTALAWAAAWNDAQLLQSMLRAITNRGEPEIQAVGSAIIAAIGTKSLETLSTLLQILESARTEWPRSVDVRLLRSVLILVSCAMGNDGVLSRLLDIFDQFQIHGELTSDEGAQIGLVLAAAENHTSCISVLLAAGLVPNLRIDAQRLNPVWEREIAVLLPTCNQLWLGREPPVLMEAPFWRSSKRAIKYLENAIVAASEPEHENVLAILSNAGLSRWVIIPDYAFDTDDFSQRFKSDRFDIVQPLVESTLENTVTSKDVDAHLNQAVMWCVTKKSRLNLLHKLLAYGADPNVKSKDLSRSALMCAAEAGNSKAVKLLLEYGADPNYRTDVYPLGAIEITLSLSHRRYKDAVTIFRNLLDSGVDVGNVDGGLSTPILIKACDMAGDPASLTVIIRELLNHDADPNLLAWNGSYGTPLIAACSMLDIDAVRLLLDAGALPNAKAKCGRFGTALIAAAYRAHLEIVEILLQYGADPVETHRPQRKSHDSGYWGNRSETQYDCALIAATQGGNIEVVQALLKCNISLNLNKIIDTNNFGTPLIASVGDLDSVNTTMVQTLCDLGADVNLVVPGYSHVFALAPLTAILMKHQDVAQLLLSRVSTSCIRENPALWSAATVSAILQQNQTLLNDLLTLQIPINQRIDDLHLDISKYGLPIIAAAAIGDVGIYEQLIQYGAQTKVMNVGKYGDCLTAAARSGQNDMVSYLLRHGANPNAANPGRKHWSPFIAAISKQHKECYDLLIQHGGNPNVFYEFSNPPMSLSRMGISLREILADRFEMVQVKRYWDNVSVADWHAGSRKLGSKFDYVLGHPLIAAVLHGDIEWAQQIITSGADINLVTSAGMSRNVFTAAFHSDARHDFAETLLLETGANPNTTVPCDIYGSGAIAAASDENLKGVEILQKHGTQLDPKQIVPGCEVGSLLLGAVCHLKSDYRDPEIQIRFLKALLDEGCSPLDEVAGSIYGNALIGAASHLRLDFIQEFLRRNASLSVNDCAGCGIFGYPLLAAIARESLTHAKFKYNYREENKKFVFVSQLLGMGADPNVMYNHRTPLIATMERVRNFDDDIVTALLKAGADPNVVVPRGLSDIFEDVTDEDERKLGPYCALVAAVEHEKHDIVEILLKYGADPKMLPEGYELRITPTVKS